MANILKFSDVFKCLNYAYGIEENEAQESEKKVIEQDEVQECETNLIEENEVPQSENVCFNNIIHDNTLESYGEFCSTLIQETFRSSKFEESFFSGTEEDDSISDGANDEANCKTGDIDRENGAQNVNGEVVKRKRMLKQSDRKVRDKLKHPLLSPCKCKNKCVENVQEDERCSIHKEFWKLDYNERLTYLSSRLHLKQIKRRRSDSKDERKRNQSCEYSFLVSSNDVKVCQKFFLRTLGFKSNKVLLTAMKKSRDGILPTSDQRGKSVPSNKFSEEKSKDIMNHIMSYDPRISHYRRAHAPNRLYLPSELTVNAMWKNYIDSGGSCSYEAYRKLVVSKNISFAALGKEECEACLEYKEHECINIVADSDMVRDCGVCSSHEEHKKRAEISRKCYQEDALKINKDDESYFSVDLQKVIMLPRLPGVKTVAFTKRIVAYNETFAPLGNKKIVKTKTAQPVAITWHQGEGNRCAQEICSTYSKFLNAFRDVKNFTFWVDNCSAQNKCWYLYNFLCHAVNSKAEMLQSVTLKYFERGHSFMSADSYHHLVEKEMSVKRNVYDFEDFLSVLNVHGFAIEMRHNDFINVPRGVSDQSKFTAQKPLMDSITVAMFRRGSTKLFWKENFSDEFKSAEFLQKKIAENLTKDDDKEFPPLYPYGSPGINISRKKDIIDKLLPLMPSNRRKFWEEIKSFGEDENEIEKRQAKKVKRGKKENKK